VTSEPPPPLASLLSKLVDGHLTEEEHDKLEAILRANPTARDYYRLYLTTHLELADTAPRVAAFPVRRRRNALLLAAAALVLAAGLGLWLPHRNAPSSVEQTPAGAVLATTSLTRDVAWSLAETPAPGLELRAGRITLDAGSIELTLVGDQIFTVAAPSEFELVDEDEVFLHRGSASLRIAGSASPCLLRVPLGTIVDLGTEFAVKVAPDGTADVWVFEGKARVDLNADASARDRRVLSAGQSVRLADTLVASPASAADFIRPLSTPPPPAPRVIADFAAEFPSSSLGPDRPFAGNEAPANGWSYLWNPDGNLGTPENYMPLAANTVDAFPAANGGGRHPMFTKLPDAAFNSPAQGDFQYGRISKTSIHPGKVTAAQDHRAIIAYTIQPGEQGEIRIANSSLAKYRVDGQPANGVDLDIYVNGRRIDALGKDGFQSLTPTRFDGSLGTLAPGDTIYVMLGNNADGSAQTYEAYDACVIDFQLVKAP